MVTFFRRFEKNEKKKRVMLKDVIHNRKSEKKYEAYSAHINETKSRGHIIYEFSLSETVILRF